MHHASYSIACNSSRSYPNFQTCNFQTYQFSNVPNFKQCNFQTCNFQTFKKNIYSHSDSSIRVPDTPTSTQQSLESRVLDFKSRTSSHLLGSQYDKSGLFSFSATDFLPSSSLSTHTSKTQSLCLILGIFVYHFSCFNISLIFIIITMLSRK